ncbi:hypothetical protein [Hahella ganghwensis]|uniref:hypothetical protein n=1 Tax=Hahella ganghwensis TaxID=286420 RepID=UPI00146170D0|nr:hypothetical protein [Hahella ganghwensis]
MKLYAKALIVTAMLSTPAFAHQANQGNAQVRGDMMGMMNSETMGMMNPEMMEMMHSHMDEMARLMGEIHDETDLEKRDNLMERHMESMQEGLHMMQRGRSEGKGEQQRQSMYMEDRMRMMEQKMEMMNMMMKQMMEHISAADRERRHLHGAN